MRTPLKRLPDAEVQGPPTFQDAPDNPAVHLEPDVEANRANWRAVTQAETGGDANLVEIQFPRPRLKTLPPSRNTAAPRSRHTGTRSSPLRATSALPPRGNPVGLIVLGAPAVSSANPRIVVSPPAKKRSLAGKSSIGGWSACRRYRGVTGRGNPSARPSATATGEDDPRSAQADDGTRNPARTI